MNKIQFIAEVSSNHNRDINRMKDFIYTSKDVGCAGVKFQLFKIDEMFSSLFPKYCSRGYVLIKKDIK